MIDINFLTPPNRFKNVSGMEFIDYQGKAFFNALTTLASNVYNATTQELSWTQTNRTELSEIISRYSNLRIIPYVVNFDNFAISAGFVSPNNVLSREGIDSYFSPEQSQIGVFFKEFKKKSLVGWCDLKTGKVEGDFKKVSFDLFVPERMFITENELKKVNKNVTMPEIIAAAILHELGHAFFGLYNVSSSVMEDIFFARTAAEINTDADIEHKVKVALEFKKETGVDVTDEVKKTGKLTVVGFKEGLADRNYRRTLSLGVTTVTPEILANAYAVRMGASVSISAIFSSFARQERKTLLMRLAELVTYTALATVGIAPAVILTLFLVRVGMSLHWSLANNSHETNYRTIKSALRDIIALIRKEKDKGDKKVVAELMEEALTLDKMANEAKPFLEGTSIQRVFSGIAHGRDAKKIDLETYTAELNYNPLSLYVQFND